MPKSDHTEPKYRAADWWLLISAAFHLLVVVGNKCCLLVSLGVRLRRDII